MTRDKRLRKDVTVIGVAVLALFGAWFFVAWCYMILAGIVHDSWWHQVPVMGYRVALRISGVLVLMAAVGSVVKACLTKE